MTQQYSGEVINMKSGQAMLLATIFFLFISLTIIFGVTVPVVNHVKQVVISNNSKQSYVLAEALNEDALYRLNTAKNLPASFSLTLNGASASASVTTSGSTKTIVSDGDANNIIRSVSTVFNQGAGIAFNYGLQAGNGGITMDGGSTINGSVYSNGNIDAISATITGTAVAANSASLTADQANDTPTTPSSSISFRDTAASQDFAQSFQVSTTEPINKFQFYIRKVGSPTNATVRLVADNNGSPSTTNISIGSVSLNSGLITGAYGWVDVVLPTNPSLIPGEIYWVVIDNSNNSSSAYYIIGANASYASGAAKKGAYSGTWNTTSLDGYFRVYTGGITSTIGRASYVGGLTIGNSSTQIGDAWASNVKGTTAYGHMYCLTGSNNNKSCDTSHGLPPSQPLPFSDANIQAWKDDAEAGGIITGATKCPGGYSSGNCTVNYAGATFGPGKITGNLTVNGGGTLTLNGPVWVQGTVSVTGGGKIVLPPGYSQNSETIVSDSTMTINGGGSLGSGSPGSYLFIVSTSQCPNDTYCSGNSAISITGGAGAIAANAQEGQVSLSGGAGIKAVVGNSITVTGGSTVTYDSGLASPSFQSGPSGAWNIQSWQEVP